MTCRCQTAQEHSYRAVEASARSHRDDKTYLEKKIKDLETELASMSPDPTRYEILEAQEVNGWLILQVKFPSCKACAFEGVKVLVYENVTPLQALKWKKLDPHFREGKTPVHEAPSPAARFPASKQGILDAQRYARVTHQEDVKDE